jgi:hypothetical protein
LYERFQPPERLTLLIEAMARDDAAEAGRLRDSCPRVSYSGPEADFMERCSMSFDILAVVTIAFMAPAYRSRPAHLCRFHSRAAGSAESRCPSRTCTKTTTA